MDNLTSAVIIVSVYFLFWSFDSEIVILSHVKQVHDFTIVLLTSNHRKDGLTVVLYAPAILTDYLTIFQKSKLMAQQLSLWSANDA